MPFNDESDDDEYTMETPSSSPSSPPSPTCSRASCFLSLSPALTHSPTHIYTLTYNASYAYDERRRHKCNSFFFSPFSLIKKARAPFFPLSPPFSDLCTIGKERRGNQTSGNLKRDNKAISGMIAVAAENMSRLPISRKAPGYRDRQGGGGQGPDRGRVKTRHKGRTLAHPHRQGAQI